jgi:xyloglucan-specific endo-beta-1,4-glucanase
MDFPHYLIQNQGYPASQYVSTIAAGTEPFEGSNAQLTTSEYTISVNRVNDWYLGMWILCLALAPS